MANRAMTTPPTLPPIIATSDFGRRSGLGQPELEPELEPEPERDVTMSAGHTNGDDTVGLHNSWNL